MATLLPYSKGDWRFIEPREVEREALKEIDDPEPYFVQGPAFTIRDGDIVVACGGVRLRGDGGGDAWIFASTWIDRHIMVARMVRDFMLAIAEDYRLQWLQVIVDTRFPRTLRWLRWLGYGFWDYLDGKPKYHIYRRNFSWA
jgi:hypothetical protein